MLRLASDNGGGAGGGDARLRALLAKVHIARKALAMEDSDYREVLRRAIGVTSAKGCSYEQLVTALAEFERLGFRGSSTRPHQPRASSPIANKARALWISLYQLGAVADPSERALEAFGKRQLGVDRLQWADQSQGFQLIEALKKIGERDGWDQHVPSRLSSREKVRLLKDRLVGAQLAKLTSIGAPPPGPIAEDRSSWAADRLESAARELGVLLRDAAKSGPA